MSKSTILTTLGSINKNLPALSPGISTALQSLNIFGEIAQSYARTLAYRAEIKRLDVELANINKQAELMHKKIDTEYQIKMEQLKNQRASLVVAFTTINHRLRNQHIEKSKLLDMAEMCMKKAFEMTNSEDRKFLLEESAQIRSQAIHLSNESSASLNKLIEKLPSVDYKQLGRS